MRPHRRQPTKAPPSLGSSRQEYWSGLLVLANTTLESSLLLVLGAHPPNSRLAPVLRPPKSSSQQYRDQVPPTRGLTGSESVQQRILRTQPQPPAGRHPPLGPKAPQPAMPTPRPSVAVRLHRGQGLAANKVGSQGTAIATAVSPATEEGPHSPRGHP